MQEKKIPIKHENVSLSSNSMESAKCINYTRTTLP